MSPEPPGRKNECGVSRNRYSYWLFNFIPLLLSVSRGLWDLEKCLYLLFQLVENRDFENGSQGLKNPGSIYASLRVYPVSSFLPCLLIVNINCFCWMIWWMTCSIIRAVNGYSAEVRITEIWPSYSWIRTFIPSDVHDHRLKHPLPYSVKEFQGW